MLYTKHISPLLIENRTVFIIVLCKDMNGYFVCEDFCNGTMKPVHYSVFGGLSMVTVHNWYINYFE